MPSDTAPFYAGSTISDLRYFVGYQDQLDTITVRAISAQPTSINVVGDKRVGKSSLLYHFCQTYEQRIEDRSKNPRNYLAIYLSLQQGKCRRKSGFYQVVVEGLCKHFREKLSLIDRNRPQNRQLIKKLQARQWNSEKFEQIILKFKAVGILPILCLDKIETLFQYPEEFNNGFYDNLRYLMDSSALMLVIASYQKLDIYSNQHKLTSSFFNLGQVMMLERFTNSEAQKLVCLPQTTIPSSKTVLNESEQQTALEWGGKNPYLLQLAGLYLWEAKQSNEDITWAKKRFDRQARGVSANHTIWRRCLLFLKWIFWGLPIKLGQVTKKIGITLSDISSWIIGILIVGVVILGFLGILPWESIKEFIIKKVSG